MNKLRHRDPETADEVIRRWQRRRHKWQQQDRAMADLRQALDESFVGRFLRWLAVRLG